MTFQRGATVSKDTTWCRCTTMCQAFVSCTALREQICVRVRLRVDWVSCLSRLHCFVWHSLDHILPTAGRLRTVDRKSLDERYYSSLIDWRTVQCRVSINWSYLLWRLNERRECCSTASVQCRPRCATAKVSDASSSTHLPLVSLSVTAIQNYSQTC